MKQLMRMMLASCLTVSMSFTLCFSALAAEPVGERTEAVSENSSENPSTEPTAETPEETTGENPVKAPEETTGEDQKGSEEQPSAEVPGKNGEEQKETSSEDRAEKEEKPLSENNINTPVAETVEEEPAGEAEEGRYKTVSFNEGSGEFSYELDLEGHKAKLISVKGDGCDIIIPSGINYKGTDYTVDAISDNAVDGGIRSLSVDEDLRTIHGNLFDWNKVTERNVGTKGEGAEDYYRYFYGSNDPNFGRCSYDEYIIYDIPDTAAMLAAIPDFITDNYEDEAYYSGKCLVRVDPHYSGDFEVKEGTVCILASAFEGCSGIQHVTLPDSVEFIGMRAFANSSIVSVNLPKGLIGHSDNIAAYTFYGCDDLHMVNIDEGVTLSNIGPYAFMDCSNLEEFDFSKVGNKALEIMCFAGAFNDAEITLRPEQFDYIANSRQGDFDYSTGEYKTVIDKYSVPAQFAKAGIKSVNFLDNEGTDELGSFISIGCFYNCDSLKSVKLSSDIKEMFASCFEGCTLLEDDILAQEGCAVERLDYRSFANTGLTEVTIPESITYFGGGIFSKDPYLTTLNWKKSNYPDSDNNGATPLFAILNDCNGSTQSQYMTDWSNKSIKSTDYIKKPDRNGNTFIETLNLYPYDEDNWKLPGIFKEQPYLKTVKIHNTAEAELLLPGDLFQFCPSLSEVTFDHPEKITSIPSNAFLCCPSLRNLQFTEMTGLKSIGSSAFLNSSDPGLSGFSAAEIEALAEGDPRKEYGLKELDLSKCEELTSIGYGAFYMQYNLESVKLPAKVDLSNSSGVFVGCSSLKTLEAACPMKNLGTVMGQNFTIPASKSFQNSKGQMVQGGAVINDVLETMILSNAGEFPVNYFFNQMASLKNLTLGHTSTVPSGAFVNCVSLESVSLPDTKIIGDKNIEVYYSQPSFPTPVFFGCKDFELNAPEVTTIGDNALAGTVFTNIDLPKATSFGKYAFNDCDKLESIDIAEGTTELNWFLFDECDNLGSVSLPSTLEKISWAAFKNCPKLTDISIPSSVSLIEDDAFAMTDVDAFDLENNHLQGSSWSFYFSKKTRTDNLKISLTGSPEIRTTLSENDMSLMREFLASEIDTSYLNEEKKAKAEALKQAVEDLLPIPDGSKIVCATTEAAETANAYKENYAPNLKVVEGSDNRIDELNAENIDVIYNGKSVSNDAVKGTAELNGEIVSGNWTFKEGQNRKDVADSGIKTVVFTPNDENISSEETTLTLTIEPKAVTVKADDKSMVTGEEEPELTATVTGLIEGEDEGLIKYVLSRESGDTAGIYTITPSGEALQGNYAVTYETGTLSITDKVKPACTHINTEVTGKKEETCMTEGYTGDIYCKDCGVRIKKGEVIPIDPDKHDFDYSNGKVTKEPTEFTLGETTYYCRHNSEHTITLQNIPVLPSTDGNDYGEFVEDTKSLSGDAAPRVETKKDEDGNEVEKKVSVGGEEVSKIVVDPESGKETVESKVWISGLEESYTYTGSAINPMIHVYDGTRKLAEKSDYTLAFKNNTEVGNAVVTIKFKGNYSGSEEQKTGFEIKPAVLGEDIKAQEIGVAANNRVQKPVPVLTWIKTGKTVNSKLFDISYDREIKDAGDYTAVITPKNTNYTGSTTVKIRVVGDSSLLLSKAKVTFNPKSYAYKGTPIEPALGSYTLKIGSVTIPKDAYRIQRIYNNTNPGTATVVFEADPANSEGYVGTKSATFRIAGKRELKETAEDEAFMYEVDERASFAKGGAKAGVIVRDGGSLLKEGTDYTLSFKNNRAVTNGEKTAEVTVKGRGNYKGSVTFKFAVDKQKLENIKDNISVADQFVPKSKLKAPSVVITDTDGKLLSLNKDYVISGVNDSDPSNTESAGIVEVTLTGAEKGSYEGECRVYFSYTESSDANLSKAGVMKKIKDQTYTGSAVKLSNADLTEILYTGSKSSPEYLVPGKDFTVVGYSSNIKKGTAKVTLKGKGKFAGKKKITFKIVQKKADYRGSLNDKGWK